MSTPNLQGIDLTRGAPKAAGSRGVRRAVLGDYEAALGRGARREP